jgi:hypothetical protein
VLEKLLNKVNWELCSYYLRKEIRKIFEADDMITTYSRESNLKIDKRNIRS